MNLEWKKFRYHGDKSYTFTTCIRDQDRRVRATGEVWTDPNDTRLKDFEIRLYTSDYKFIESFSGAMLSLK